MDKLAIKQDPQEVLAEIEKKCTLHPITFLKENYNYLPIKEISKLDHFDATLITMILKIFALSGIKGELDELSAGDIDRFILSACGTLTLEEIYKAFELERFGTYGDKTDHYSLFNSVYVSEVIKKYKIWKAEQRRIHQINKINDVPEITGSEKKEIVSAGIIRVFNEYKETKMLPAPNGYIFDELYERKIIKSPTTAGIINYYNKKQEEASFQLQNELKSEQSVQVDKNDRKAIAREIDKIIAGNSEKITMRAKSIILAEFFDKLISQGKSINELII